MITVKCSERYRVVDDLLDLNQAAALFQCTPLSVRNWQRCEGMPYVRIKGAKRDSIRYDLRELVKWAEANEKALNPTGQQQRALNQSNQTPADAGRPSFGEEVEIDRSTRDRGMPLPRANPMSPGDAPSSAIDRTDQRERVPVKGDEENSAAITDDVQAIAEGRDDETPLDIPPERRRVKTEKQDLPVETLHNWVERGRLNLQPDFQRQFVWSKKKASRLIESLLLEIPVPVIYVAKEADGTMPVVDGQQRLTSISAFISGKFPDGQTFRLSSLQVLTELNGKWYRDLDQQQQEQLLGATLRLIIIERDSDPGVKFEVFERLNLGAEKLNDQELRNSMYRGTYNDLLKELSSNQHMMKVMHASQPHKRMADCQLILRFFAMWRNTHLKYRSPVKQFMNREIEAHRHASEKEIADMRALFQNAIETAYVVFGSHAFRRFYPGEAGNPDGHWEKDKLNVSLWDTALYAFAFFEKRQIIPLADRVREELIDLMANDDRFVEYITSTGDLADRVRYRADEWLRRLKDLVGDARSEPRGFSLELKRRLFDANPVCQICKQEIQDVDDAEVDHVQHYWRGGKTIPENARLTHRYCNRARGARA